VSQIGEKAQEESALEKEWKQIKMENEQERA
jgi:hypothetical protein